MSSENRVREAYPRRSTSASETAKQIEDFSCLYGRFGNEPHVKGINRQNLLFVILRAKFIIRAENEKLEGSYTFFNIRICAYGQYY